MNPALLGTLSLLIALLLSLLQCIFAVIKKVRLNLNVIPIATLFFTSCAFAALLYAHATSDFRLLNVVLNSHSTKPLIYKISGAWGNHEGSMLLFIWMLSVYSALFAITTASLTIKKSVLTVQNAILSGFLLFILLTSNPFIVVSPVPSDGNGQNPILQDIGLAIHPPMLYAGYTGFSLVLSLAIAILLAGEIPAGVTQLLKKWIIIPWCFLTIGIALGSWWAYRVLGWGGFWFWDPVENSSLMPWLAATALYHSAVILQKRGNFALWVMFLGILTFSLSLIGFFLVRSGVIASVHSFASDPMRGIFILLLLGLISGSGLLIFAIRAHKLVQPSHFAIASRESAIMLNNLFLITLCMTVFLGTVYPLLLEVISNDVISVGAPYYYRTFIPIALALIASAGIGPFLKWHKNDASILRKLRIPFFMTVVIAVGLYAVISYHHSVFFLGIVLGLWLIIATLMRFYQQSSVKNSSFYAMMIAHLGLGILVLGIAGSQGWSMESERNMTLHEQIHFARYEIQFNDVSVFPKHNYIARRGVFTVSKKGILVATLTPETRNFSVENSQTTESAIFYDGLSNLYVVIGMQATPNSFAVRLYYRPLVVLIWIGAIMIASGGVVSLWRKKYEG